jgi:hypothetical protein
MAFWADAMCPYNSLSVYGTGSYPPLPQGLQRRTRQMASPVPLNAPYFWIASYPYWEQLGSNRQEGGNIGEITFW